MPNADQNRKIALIAYHVARARLGHQADFTALVELCGGGLLAHARRLCDDRDTAHDIVQEAWLDIARSLHKLNDDRAFLAFALRIVTRKAARDLHKKQRRRDADAQFAQTRPTDTPAQTDAGDLEAAIHALPEAQRVTLALFHLEGLSVAETAHALNIPPGTVKTRLMNARARLRAFLEGDQT